MEPKHDDIGSNTLRRAMVATPDGASRPKKYIQASIMPWPPAPGTIAGSNQLAASFEQYSLQIDQHAEQWQQQVIEIRSENMTTCVIINKQGSHRHQHLHQLASKIFHHCHRYKVRQFATYMPCTSGGALWWCMIFHRPLIRGTNDQQRSLSFSIIMTFTFTSYIRDHAGPSFNIVDCFRASKLTDQEAAEKKFKKAVKAVSFWKPSAAQSWASEQIRNKFLILSNVDLKSYWVSTTKSVAILKAKRTFYEFCGEAFEPIFNKETEDGSYNPDSQSECSSESTKIRRKQKFAYDYLVGGGLEQYDRPSNCKKWISLDMDLVDEFLKYRSGVVKEAKELELLSMADRLALNFICYITPSLAIGNGLDPSVWSTMVK
ncbi:hypothetical protein BDB00DRAFT_876534, partial [Zychaea mexicana]|uniref:uncharacterized protein n=1 Tax=Zychaea mexicana TaxID=64656 RepID=UPI0022FEF893